ncbi:MAG TPA: DUF3298 and DUF4163 domain-containing protein [Caulobacteraceae bacterium]|jgi:hypothetical protein|nr:DUF3298 and DUF4163 domain-containing protein [Caulobacteraceae bacterium]
MRTRLRIATTLGLLALAACGPKTEQAAQAPPAAPAAPAAPLPPLTWRNATADAEVSLSLPPAVGRIPALYARLFAGGRNDLQAFAEGAKGELEERRANGETVRPYGRSLDYAVSAETPRLLSLVLNELESTGGAHPNTTLSATVWDKQAGRMLKGPDLFAPGADMAAADKALCDAVHAAKLARVKDPALTGELTSCPRLRAAALAVAPSTVPGKAGGVIALFSPYALGAYAEGAYRIVLPQAAVRGVLAPAYAAEFAGMPAPGSDKGPES